MRMKGKIKRILEIIKTAGLKNTAQMVMIKIERALVGFLSPVFIFLSKHLAFTANKKNNNILILLEQRYSVSALNRAYDLAEFLRMSGFNVHISTPLNSVFNIIFAQKYSAIVFQRCIQSDIIDAYLSLADANGIKTIYDCDDLTYDPDMAFNLQEDVHSSSERLLRVATEHYNVYSKCKYFLTTTDYLAAHTQQKDPAKQVFILRNGLNKRFTEICNNLNCTSRNNEKITIGYMSGTASHNADFKLIEKPLFEIMKKYSNVYLKIVGLLKVPEMFLQPEFRNRIIRVPLVDFYRLPEIICNFSINIAPSIMGNPFTEGKSELKYVYAGCLGIPTIASATDAFKTSITNSENGFLCNNESDWLNAFEVLITKQSERERIGARAKQHIENEYTAESMKLKAEKIFTKIITGAETK